MRLHQIVRIVLASTGLLAFGGACGDTPTASPSATAGTAATATSGNACPALLQKSFKRLQDGAPQDLCQFTGKVILVVNTASYCGYTSQYEGLEKLYAKEASRGLVVLGFPSNDFGEQEPGQAKQIADFCFNTYGVKFPMFEKSVVQGPQANALYQDLARLSGKAPAWNFHKYLIDRQGRVLASFASKVTPEDASLQKAIQQALHP